MKTVFLVAKGEGSRKRDLHDPLYDGTRKFFSLDLKSPVQKTRNTPIDTAKVSSIKKVGLIRNF
jgi:hypothetical protein